MEQKNYGYAPVVDARSASDYHKTSNFVFKILALLMAIGIWFYAQSVNNPSSEAVIADVPIRVVNLENQELSVMTGGDLTVDLTVSGKKKDLDKLTADSFSVVADASGITTPGEYTLRPEVLSKPDGITVTARSTSIVQVYLDVKDKVEVPVTVRLTDWALDDGFEMGDPVPSVKTVSVTGPSTLLEKIAAAQVTLSLAGHQVSSSLNMSGQVVLVNAQGQTVRDSNLICNLSDIEVFIPVYAYKELPLRVDTLYGYYTDANTDITITPASVRVKGDPSLLATMTGISLSVLDETRITSDTVTLPISMPDELINVSGTESAEVRIRHKGTVLTDFVVRNITVKNAGNLQYQLCTTSLNVKIRTAREDLSLLSTDNITAVADLSRMEQANGRTQIPVTIVITGMNGAMAYAVGEYWITVDFG